MAKAKRPDNIFEYLKERGLQGTELVISDAHKGLVSAIRKSFTNVSWQDLLPEFKIFQEAVKGILSYINLAREDRLIHDYIVQKLAHH